MENKTSTQRPRITEAVLTSSLNQHVHALVRDLSMACRKVGIYGANHPMAATALERPFLTLNKLFLVRRDVTFNLQNSQLFVLNIRLKESSFTDDIVQLMQIMDVRALRFTDRVSASDLARFVGRLVTRVRGGDSDNLLSQFLRENRIDTIEVNTEAAVMPFETQRRYRGDIDGDFSVRHICLQQIGDDPLRVARLLRDGRQTLEQYGIGFSWEVVEYLLPERVASFDSDELASTIIEVGRAVVEGQEDTPEGRELSMKYKSLMEMLDYHPDQDVIMRRLEDSLRNSPLTSEQTAALVTPTSAIRLETQAQVSEAMDRVLDGDDASDDDAEQFCDAFSRILKTGQRGKAQEVLTRLLGLLGAQDSEARMRSLSLLEHCLGQLSFPVDTWVFERTVTEVAKKLQLGGETFEYSEFVWQLIKRGMGSRRYDLVAHLTEAMAGRRRTDGDVTVHESVAVKKAFDSINRSGVISTLVDELVQGEGETVKTVSRILISIGSEAVAMELSQVISHPVRKVRQLAIKILAELGSSSLKVFSAILADDNMFGRDAGRRELPDARWYVVRNCVFVLGLLKDERAVESLRQRIDDPDVRVRREIISALEKIGGDDACDLLVVMAQDADREIGESAVIALGLIGSPEIAPLLIDVGRKRPALAVRVVSALGKLGGADASVFLQKLFEDDSELATFGQGQVSKDDLRVAIVRALGRIGDEKALSGVRGYKENLSTTQRLFFKNSALQKAISEVLSKQPS